MTTHVATLGFDEIEEDLRAWDALAGEAPSRRSAVCSATAATA